MNKITCEKCGASIDSKSLFCNFCGAAVTDVKDILKEKAMLEVEKEKNEEYLRTLSKKTKILNARQKAAMIFAAFGMIIIFLMCLIGTGRI